MHMSACACNLHVDGCLLNLECVSALYSTPYVWYRMLGWVRHIQCIVKYMEADFVRKMANSCMHSEDHDHWQICM